MDKSIEPRTAGPQIHGRMRYRCDGCGKSWFMYLEKGIEEFGENHKPSPLMIVCPYCGGLASDVSGIQKVPGGGYVKLPGEYMYFANLEDRDCGVPMLHEAGIARSGAKILIADELDAMNGGQCIRQIMGELLEDMRKRTEEYINDMVTKEALAEAQAEARSLIEAARTLAEPSAYSTEEVLGAILNALGGYDKSKNTRRAVERENAARFRQYRARESAWATRKRTGQRRREWRGPWREKNN